MSNPFAALDDVSEGSVKKTEKKTETKVQPKPQEKKVTAPVTSDKPKQPKPKTEKTVSVTQDGFEQVGKTQRGGRPQRGSSDRGRGGDRGSFRGSRGGDRGSSRGTRGDRGSSRGGFTRPPRTDSNTGSEETPSKDIREKHDHKKGEFRNERTGEPKQGNARGRGRFHDHHLSGTGTRGGFKKRGGGGHNWGTPKDDVVEEPVATETTQDEPKEEVVVDPLTLSEDQKKAARKKRKDAEKKERKGTGKKDDDKKEKSDELSIDQVKVLKVDPTQKTFEEYQKEKSKKAPVEVKKEEVKPKNGIDVKELFKSGVVEKKKATSTTGGAKSKSVPKVSNSKDFPTLK